MSKLEPVLRAALEKSAREVPCCAEKDARIAELEVALREIGSYELNYARQESPLEALLALQRYARAALEGKE